MGGARVIPVGLAQDPAHSECSLNGSSHSAHHRKDREAGGAASLAPSFLDLSLPSRSTADSLSDGVRIVILPSHDEEYLPLLCAYPLEGASPHKHKALSIKSGEQKLTPSQYHPQQPFHFFFFFPPGLKTFVVFQ